MNRLTLLPLFGLLLVTVDAKAAEKLKLPTIEVAKRSYYDTAPARKIAELTRQIAAQPKNPNFYLQRGRLRLLVMRPGNFWDIEGDKDAAKADFEKAISLAPADPVGYLARAEAATVDSGDKAKATGIAARNEAKTELSADELDKLKWLDLAVKKLPQNLSVRENRIVGVSALIANKVPAAMQIGDAPGDKGATELFNRLEQDGAALAALEQQKVVGLMLEARARVGKGEKLDTTSYYKQALQINPTQTQNEISRYALEANQAQVSPALIYWFERSKEVKVEPLAPFSWRVQSQFAVEQQMNEEALQAINLAIGNGTEAPKEWREWRAKIGKAIYYNLGAQKVSATDEPTQLLAKVKRREELLQNAIVDFENSEPTAANLYQLAQLRFEAKDYKGAAQASAQSLEARDNQNDVWLFYGLASAMSGDATTMRQAYARGLAGAGGKLLDAHITVIEAASTDTPNSSLLAEATKTVRDARAAQNVKTFTEGLLGSDFLDKIFKTP